MPKKLSRRERRRGRQAFAPAAAPQPQPVAATPMREAAAPQPVLERPPDSSVITSARDYSYIRREIRRIAVLAVAIIAVIVVLSFIIT